MKICLYSPYVPKHIGGGEKYFFDVAKVLADEGHQVLVGVHETDLDPEKIRAKYERFLGYSLSAVQFISTPIGTSAGFLKKLFWTRQFDVLYYATDGSLFFSLAKKNIVHIQIPFTQPKKGFVERLKLANWLVKNTNSAFTKKVIEEHWQTQVQYVHYPMVTIGNSSPKIEKKEKIILHVGRFFTYQHSKRQDVLVEIFRELRKKYPKELEGWQLVLIGSVEDQKYAARVAEKAKGLPIKIIHELNRAELLEWYAKSAIYWHATGFGIDEEKHPECTEHFGISTVEAMLSLCVPIVLGKGGQLEVLGDALKELLWQTPDECIKKTLTIIEDKKAQKMYALKAAEQAKQFNSSRFRETLDKMIAA